VSRSVRFQPEQISAVTDSVPEQWRADHAITDCQQCICIAFITALTWVKYTVRNATDCWNSCVSVWSTTSVLACYMSPVEYCLACLHTVWGIYYVCFCAVCLCSWSGIVRWTMHAMSGIVPWQFCRVLISSGTSTRTWKRCSAMLQVGVDMLLHKLMCSTEVLQKLLLKNFVIRGV